MKIESPIGSSIFSFLCQFIFLTKMDGCFCEICALNYTETLQNWVIWWSFLFLNTKFKMSILQLQLSHNVSMLSSSLQTNRKIRFMRTRCQISVGSSVLKHIRYKQVQWWQNLLYHPMIFCFRYILKFA